MFFIVNKYSFILCFFLFFTWCDYTIHRTKDSRYINGVNVFFTGVNGKKNVFKAYFAWIF